MNNLGLEAPDPAADWRSQAVCAGLKKPDAMFPDPGNKPAVDVARAVCSICPVATACLEDALAEEGGRNKGNRFGVRGGKSPAQRYSIYTARRPSAETAPKPRGPGRSKSPCGTPAAYDRHCLLQEPIDDACRQAHNEKNRQQKARKREAERAAVEGAAA